jgi:hypothetical protein
MRKLCSFLFFCFSRSFDSETLLGLQLHIESRVGPSWADLSPLLDMADIASLQLANYKTCLGAPSLIFNRCKQHLTYKSYDKENFKFILSNLYLYLYLYLNLYSFIIYISILILLLLRLISKKHHRLISK